MSVRRIIWGKGGGQYGARGDPMGTKGVGNFQRGLDACSTGKIMKIVVKKN